MFRIFSHYVSIKSFLLMILESLIITLSLVFAAELRFWNHPSEFASYIAFPEFAIQLLIVVIVCLLCFYCNDLYNVGSIYTSVDSILRIEQALGTASLLLGLLYFLFPGLLLSRGVFLIGMLLAAGFLILGRKFLDSAWQWTSPAN